MIKITEKQLCMNCKHLAHDGMAGIWCSVHGNNENYDCPKFEYNYGILTKEEAINNLKRLYYENNRLKQRITTQSVDREQLVKRINEVKKENKQLKKENQKLIEYGKELLNYINSPPKHRKSIFDAVICFKDKKR